MYYDNYSVKSFQLIHTDTDILVKKIENKVTTPNGLITTINPSITEHRSDRGEVVIGTVYAPGTIVRFNYAKGIDIELKEGIFTLLDIKNIIGIERA